jgi:hypothetical protein
VTQTAGGSQTLTCPQCGLVLTIKRVKGGTHLSYDTRDWKQRCKDPELDSPVLCLLEKTGGGASEPDGSQEGESTGRPRPPAH